jgi:hypothetical protein
VVGFIEAEGSFFVTQKNPGYFVHGFSVTQSLDTHVLEFIRHTLGIRSKIRGSQKHGCVLDTCQNATIVNISSYFRGVMIGIKSVELSFWSEGLQYRKDMERMASLQLKLRIMRKQQLCCFKQLSKNKILLGCFIYLKIKYF